MATKNQAAASTTGYEVLSPITHDGKPYAVGSTVDLTDEQAAPLLDVEAVKAPAAKA